MTFDEYIQNPMGKTNSVISNRIMYRNMYQEKLDKIMVREAGKVDYKAYKDNTTKLSIPKYLRTDFKLSTQSSRESCEALFIASLVELTIS